jgi:hypothetical protein
MALSSGFVQQETDSIAKAIRDMVAVPGSTSALATGVGTTWLNRIGALGTPADIYLLLDGAMAASGLVSAWIARETSLNDILDSFFPFLAALDAGVANGLAAFLQANSVQVDPYFLDAFNRAVGKGSKNPSAILKPHQAFGNAVADMGHIAVSGATTGVFTAGTSVDSRYGNAPLYLYNADVDNTGGGNRLP